MNANNRRYRRYRIRMPVSLVIGKRTLSLQTGDVGMGGVFIRTDAPPNENELVRLTIDLPFGGGTLALLGRATFVRRPGPNGQVPGVGIAFYGNGPADHYVWQKLMREIERRYPESVEREVVLAEPTVAAPAAPRPEMRS